MNRVRPGVAASLILTLFASFCMIHVGTPTAEASDTNQWVPEKAITIVVPFAAGGGSDIRARIVARHWTKYLPGNKPVVVLNKPGGGGVIGLTEVYGAKPDGYTVVLPDTVPMVLNQLTSDVKYDGKKLEGIGQVNAYTRVLVTNPKTIPDIRSWDQMIAKIYDLKIATVGFGSTPHMAMVAVGKVGGFYDPAKLRLVHYSGTSGAIAGFQRGEVDLMLGAVESHSTYVLDKLMNFLVVFSDEPHVMCPETPTSVKLNIPKAKELNAITYGNSALYAPPGTPEMVLKTLAETYEKTLKDPELQADAKKANNMLSWLSREKVNKITKDLYELWATQEEALKIFKGQ